MGRRAWYSREALSAGSMYPAILDCVSNIKQDYPEGFAGEVQQVIKRTPKSYQLASMAFVKEVCLRVFAQCSLLWSKHAASMGCCSAAMPQRATCPAYQSIVAAAATGVVCLRMFTWVPLAWRHTLIPQAATGFPAQAQAARLVQEATNEAGLQRHIWFPMPLLDGQAGAAYVSPLFDAIWVADSPKQMEHCGGKGTPAVRDSGGLQIFGAPAATQATLCALAAVRHERLMLVVAASLLGTERPPSLCYTP